MTTEQILADRGKTHGDFTDNARISEELMRVLSSGPSFERLTDTQLNALRMIMHKASRIVSGNPNEKDSWVDIGGYAKLAEDRIQIKHPDLPFTKYTDPFGD